MILINYMINFSKRLLKNLLSKTQWRINKIYKNKYYVNQKPNFEVIKALYNSSGVIHMGAHRGVEAPIYDWFQKKTIWIEANPQIIPDLIDNVSRFPYQKIIVALLSNQDDENLEFKISNNDSASSSIFDFGKKSLDQNLKMISKINLKSQKFDTIVKKNFIELNNYNFWVIDLQGSELLALNGAIDSIKKCKSILIEVSKSDYYSNGAKWDELKNFLNKHHFIQKWEPEEDHTDVLFLKEN